MSGYTDTQRLDWLIADLLADGEPVLNCHPDGPRAEIDRRMQMEDGGRVRRELVPLPEKWKCCNCRREIGTITNGQASLADGCSMPVPTFDPQVWLTACLGCGTVQIPVGPYRKPPRTRQPKETHADTGSSDPIGGGPHSPTNTDA